MSRVVEVKVWAIVAFVLCVVVAVVAGVTWSDHLNQQYVTKLHAETLAREAEQVRNQARFNRETANRLFDTCNEQNDQNAALTEAVTRAFSGTVSITPADIAKLPAITQTRLVELQPLLTLSARNAQRTKEFVLESIPAQQICTKPG